MIPGSDPGKGEPERAFSEGRSSLHVRLTGTQSAERSFARARSVSVGERTRIDGRRSYSLGDDPGMKNDEHAVA
jgi:hypothetical protein